MHFEIPLPEPYRRLGNHVPEEKHEENLSPESNRPISERNDMSERTC